MAQLDKKLDRDALLDVAGERYFERGVEYYNNGRDSIKLLDGMEKRRLAHDRR